MNSYKRFMKSVHISHKGNLMNIFEKFSLSKEVIIENGEISVDKQRIVFLPVPVLGLYLTKLKNNSGEMRKLYETMKKGATDWSIPLGKEYALSYTDYLDRWLKYTAFGGWGITEYQLVEKDKKHGFLRVRNLSLHKYLKEKGITELCDVIFEGLAAGSISGSLAEDLDVIEVQCICAGSDFCVFYWGSKEYLLENFPEAASKKFGDIK